MSELDVTLPLALPALNVIASVGADVLAVVEPVVVVVAPVVCALGPKDIVSLVPEPPVVVAPCGATGSSLTLPVPVVVGIEALLPFPTKLCVAAAPCPPATKAGAVPDLPGTAGVGIEGVPCGVPPVVGVSPCAPPGAGILGAPP